PGQKPAEDDESAVRGLAELPFHRRALRRKVSASLKGNKRQVKLEALVTPSAYFVPSPSGKGLQALPRKRSSAASAAGSISVGACPTPGTATSSPFGSTSTMRRACASERTSLSVPHTTRVGQGRRWSIGHNAGRGGAPRCTRCWM